MAFQKGSTGPSSFNNNTGGTIDLDALLSGALQQAPAQPAPAEVAPSLDQAAYNVGPTPYQNPAETGQFAGITSPQESIADDVAIQEQLAGGVGINTNVQPGQRADFGPALEQAGQQYLNTPTGPSGRTAGAVADTKRKNVDQDGVDIVNTLSDDFSEALYDPNNSNNGAAKDVTQSIAEGLQVAGLNPASAVTSLAGARGIAKAAMLNNISNYKYSKQAETDENSADPDNLAVKAVPNQEVFDSLRSGDNKNPAVQGLIGDYADKLQYQTELNAKIQEGSIDPNDSASLYQLRNNLNPQAKANFRRAATRDIINDVETGSIVFGRDKKGNLIPTINRNETNVDFFFNEPSKGQARAGLGNALNGVFPEDAPAFRTGIRAQSTPLGNNTHSSKIAADKAGRKAYTGETGITNRAALNVLSNTAVGFSNTLSSLASLMAQAGAPSGEGQAVQVSASPFAGTLAKMDEAALQEYTSTKGVEGAKAEISKHNAQVQRHLTDYVPNASGRPLYQTFHNSEATTRFFPDSVDVNYVNHKGTIRPLLSFKSIPTVQVRPGDNIWQSPTTGNDKILSTAKNVYKEGVNAADRGQRVDRQLKALSKDHLLALNYRYNLGVQMSKHILGRDDVSRLGDGVQFTKPFSQWSELDYIEFGSIPSIQAQAAELGAKLANVQDPQQLEELANDANFKGWLTKRGEWGYPASVLLDANQIANAYNPNIPGNTIKLENKMEADARQSNAAIMSALIGDTETAQLLGIVSQGGVGSLENFDSLRDKIGKGLPQAVATTFTGGGETETKTKALWTNAVKVYMDTDGATKGYGRGIVVAGLYGKSSLRMYTEGVDFLNHMQTNAQTNPELKQALDAIAKHYSLNSTDGGIQFNNKKILDDVTDLFTTSAKTHMSKLLGFQSTMKGIGSLKGAANGSTQITSLSGNTQQVVPSTFGPVYNEHNSNEGLSMAMESIGGGFEIASTQAINSAAAGKGARSYQDYDAETGAPVAGAFTQSKDIPGTKVRDAMAVDLIQGLDSALMAMTIVNANFNPKTGKATEVPYSMMPIHDAIISGPDGHLIAHNAYNNISMPQLVKKMPGYFKNILDDTYAEISADKKVHKNGGNIGRAFFGKGAQQSSPAVSGHFDRLYDYAYGNKSVDVGNLEELTTAQAKQFWQGAQGGRDNRESRLRLQKASSDVYLRAAYALGWRPDNAAFADKRDSNRVSGENYAKLLDLISINEQLAETDSVVVAELNEAIAEVSKATGVPLERLKGSILGRKGTKRKAISATTDNYRQFMKNFDQTGRIITIVPE